MADSPAPANEGLSWFGPSQTDTDLGDLPDDEGPGQPSPADSRYFFRRARGGTQVGGNAFQRLYRAFMGARAALGLALVATLLLGQLLGAQPERRLLLICLGYALATVLAWGLPALKRAVSPRRFSQLSSPQWWSSIGLDLLVFGLLNGVDRDTSVGFSALFVMPVLMAGILTPRLLSLATSAVAALTLLGLAGWNVLHGIDVGMHATQAGLVGSGLFVVGLLSGELASRLAREEQAARGSMEFARQQAQLNRLVIDEMQEGVLVVDRRGRVRTANPAACALLGQLHPVSAAPFQLRSAVAWSGLVKAVDEAFASGHGPEAGQDVILVFPGGMKRSLRLRMRFTQGREDVAGEDLCVLLIEDNRQVLARSRQEKLAAMGRVSAGIAHEIRNPLAAIDQANALLAEDLRDPRAQQLTRMVSSNVQRLKRIVDDVMEVAPGVGPAPVALDACALVRDCAEDWAQTNQVSAGADSPLRSQLPSAPLAVLFEPEHLRRVLVNLLDNAQRHASAGPGSVRLKLAPVDGQTAVLSVTSLGEPIAPEIERHLFEPFFSTRSRGSGLGLYICRELCERYGARIDYRASDEGGRGGNEFRVMLRRADAVAALTMPVVPSPPVP